ncbi:MAG TPA: DUF1615 family protein [Desulfomonilaceae bacterium]|nr:DUF1615 family protein [Desulfomonilaceae bacterium]
MKIVSDEASVEPVRSAERTQEMERKPRPEEGDDAAAHDEVVKAQLEEMRRLQPSVDEESILLQQTVQVLDKDAAAMWLAGFISEKPLNCPLKEQKKWVDAILFAVERNGLPLCKEIIALTASLISIESGFHADPLAVDPSRGEDLSCLLDRAEQELYQKFGFLMSIPPVPQLYAVYKKKYYPRLAACRTEGEIEMVAKALADELKSDAGKLPRVVRDVVYKEIDKISDVVKTKGSMQLNFLRACKVMKDRGEVFTNQELTDYMYTMNGGVDVGVAALRPMFVQYAARYATPGSLSWLFFVGMDYHYGPFSSRNMMEQVRIRDLSGHRIPIDGDFLHYDEKARPERRDSETLLAAMTAFPSLDKSAVVRTFVLEKDQHYIYSDLHRMITEAHRNRFGETPFAVIGELAMGDNAQMKHGASWKTKSYLKKLDRYLNSIPWDN